MLLLVDDDKNVLHGYRRILEKVYNVDTANSGNDALDLIRGNDPYAVIVSDIDMPGMNGIDFLQQAHQLSPESTKLALSGSEDRNSVIAAINSGRVHRYLTKPINPKELTAAIDDAIGAFLQNQQQKLSATISNESFVEYGRDLSRAVRNKELFVEYQPQVSLMTGKVTGVEALMRWQHPEFGLVPPSNFIPIAEVTGAIVPITNWLLDTTARDLENWNRLGLDLNLAVNISAAHFAKLDLLDNVRRRFDRRGRRMGQLELEITETVLTDSPETLHAGFRQLADLGVGLALDDFGSGFMRYDYLKNLPITKLKIDGSYIRRIEEDSASKAIVKSLLAAGESMGIDVVAEGLETEQQYETLVELECGLAQGFFCARPMPFESLTNWMFQQDEDRVWPRTA